VILQTVWATTADIRFGHRRTDIETVPDLDNLVHQLNQLAAVIFGLDRLAPRHERASAVAGPCTA
jgi:hypothetical protein